MLELNKLYNMDCMQGMKEFPDGFFDLAIVDPPYGNIYSKTDYFALLQRLKTALKAAGFYGITINAEVYEQDTGYYHVPVEIKYMEV